MRLLIFTQKIDSKDSTLGFFHSWVNELAKKSERIEIICLENGSFDLPKNVIVYSLGKEEDLSKFSYIINFYKYLKLISGSYDRVFVHMNQEYVLLAGLYWRFKGIPVYLWRNHPNGSVLTGFAVLLSTKVFCTSTGSFTARFKKSIIMPVGVDTNLFRYKEAVVRKKYSVCMVGRISPIKHVELALEAVREIVSSGGQVSLSIIGNPTEKDVKYYFNLKKYVEENNLSTCVSFTEAVSPDNLPEIYNSHEICLNLTPSGSFDKTIVEAAACGAIPLVSNQSLRQILPEACLSSPDVQSIGQGIQRLFDPSIRIEIRSSLEKFIKSNSISSLMIELLKEFE